MILSLVLFLSNLTFSLPLKSWNSFQNELNDQIGEPIHENMLFKLSGSEHKNRLNVIANDIKNNPVHRNQATKDVTEN